MRKALALAVIVLASLSCSSRERHVRVAIIVHIDTPSNLSTSSECRALWGNVQRFGAEMDAASPEWNKVVIQSAYELIQKGCVESRGGE